MRYLHSFPKAFKLPGLFYTVCVFCFLLTGVLSTNAQAPEYSFAPADSQFVMQLQRVKGEVIITLTFKDSIDFDYITIERKADFSDDFSQCKYITSADVKAQGHHMVKKDTYAFPASSSVLYRVKVATKDGAMRIYPPLSLPAVSK